MFVVFDGSKKNRTRCKIHGMCAAETSNRLEPTSVRAVAGMVKVSRNDSANGWAAEGC